MRGSGVDPEVRFGQLVGETRRDLLAYALRRTGSAEDAADVVAETYLTAWRKLDSIPKGGAARLWLFGVARNVLARGASRNHALGVTVERLALELHEASPSVELADHERGPTIEAALSALPPRQREVLLLSAWEGLTPREIAAVTGASVNLVRVRLHRARARMKQELLEAEPDPIGICHSVGRADLRAG